MCWSIDKINVRPAQILIRKSTHSYFFSSIHHEYQVTWGWFHVGFILSSHSHMHRASGPNTRTCFHLLILWSIAYTLQLFGGKLELNATLRKGAPAVKNYLLLTQSSSLETLLPAIISPYPKLCHGREVRNRGTAKHLHNP